MSKKKRRRRRSQAAAAAGASKAAAAPPGRFDAGGWLMVRRVASWLIDYALSAGLVSVFYFCAQVFYLDETTMNQGNLMLICAVVTLLFLTVLLPLQAGGQTLGERLLRIRVRNRDGSERTWIQLLARECVLKIACGPFLIVFCALDYGILGLLIHRDPDHELILDAFSKTRVVPVTPHR